MTTRSWSCAVAVEAQCAIIRDSGLGTRPIFPPGRAGYVIAVLVAVTPTRRSGTLGSGPTPMAGNGM